MGPFRGNLRLEKMGDLLKADLTFHIGVHLFPSLSALSDPELVLHLHAGGPERPLRPRPPLGRAEAGAAAGPGGGGLDAADHRHGRAGEVAGGGGEAARRRRHRQRRREGLQRQRARVCAT